jgi:hypothetical protein
MYVNYPNYRGKNDAFHPKPSERREHYQPQELSNARHGGSASPLVGIVTKAYIFSWGIGRPVNGGNTCYNDGEAAGVDTFGDLLRRGRGSEPAGARLAGDERQDSHRVGTKKELNSTKLPPKKRKNEKKVNKQKYWNRENRINLGNATTSTRRRRRLVYCAGKRKRKQACMGRGWTGGGGEG